MFYVATSLVISNENSCCDLLFSCFMELVLRPQFDVVTSIRCCDLTLSAFTAFLCHDLDLMS